MTSAAKRGLSLRTWSAHCRPILPRGMYRLAKLRLFVTDDPDILFEASKVRHDQATSTLQPLHQYHILCCQSAFGRKLHNFLLVLYRSPNLTLLYL